MTNRNQALLARIENLMNDLDDFRAYLAQCTRDQLFAVIEKESNAGRDVYVRLALQELKSRLA